MTTTNDRGAAEADRTAMPGPGDSDLARVDALLADRRAIAVPAIDDAFMARLMADAAGALPGAAFVAPGTGVARGPAAPQGWRGLLAAIGGWPAAGGLVAATATGLWIGIAPPPALDAFASAVIGESVAIDLAGSAADFGLEV